MADQRPKWHWNPELLDRHLAPGISEFTACDAPDLRDHHPQAQYWLSNHFLNSVFGARFKGKVRQYAVNLLYRAQAGFEYYHQAISLTRQYLEESGPHRPAARLYFSALSQWESCFLNHQIFIDVLRQLTGSQIFERSDESAEQRCYDMASTIKHIGGRIADGRHLEEDTVPMWLTNDGFATRELRLSYRELGELIQELAKIADDLQNPGALAKIDEDADKGQPTEAAP